MARTGKVLLLRQVEDKDRVLYELRGVYRNRPLAEVAVKLARRDDPKGYYILLKSYPMQPKSNKAFGNIPYRATPAIMPEWKPMRALEVF